MQKTQRTLGVLFVVIGIAFSWAVRPAHADDDVGWLLGQINSLRATHGLGPLALNPQLQVAATGHSQYLANNPWTHPHIEANGSTPQSRIAAAGFSGSPVGENVYGGGLATAAIAFNWWVASPVHLQGMVHSAFGQIGIGVASGPYGKFFTTDFGGGGISVPPPQATSAPANVQSSDGQPAATQPPKPTRRPASPVPTTTPSITWTPSPTFTALPSRTPTSTGTLEPPTPTAIVLEVSPQPGAQVLMIATFTAQPSPTHAVATNAVSPSPIQTTPPTLAAPSPANTSDPIRTLIPFAIGVQVLILGGVLLRRNRNNH